MTENPLDAEITSFDQDRPAGPWLESYWAQIAPWAKRFAYIIVSYLILSLAVTAKNLLVTLKEMDMTAVIAMIAVVSIFLPLCFLGFYSHQFGRYLERALAEKDQMLLERSFKNLRHFLRLALYVAIFLIAGNALALIQHLLTTQN
jgi:predicted PurR-regulated permease PerM